MKNKLLVFATIMMLPGLAMAQITGSKHDLTNATNAVYSTDTGRICVFCHVPHNADSSTQAIWNRSAPASAATWGFTTSVGGTTLPANINSPSLRCLSCHDGTANIGALLNAPGTNGPGTLAMLGADQTAGVLSNAFYTVSAGAMAGNHPVSIPYSGTGWNPGGTGYNTIVPGASAAASGWETVANARTAGLKFYPDADGDLGVECGSCHDPHLTANTFFLRVSTVGSALCVGCHTK